jgi:ketosteroid isomerase-like protein
MTSWRIGAVTDTADLLRDHVAAFNAHDSARVLAGLAGDVVWRTGTDTVRGIAAAEELFDDWLWSLRPSLEIRSLVAGEGAAAAELVERLTHEGQEQVFPIAVFLRFEGDLIAQATVYREGSADLETDLS